jgi:glyoxylate reductase
VAWALKERLIAGAALDVYEQEPEVTASLMALENVVLAPHLGSATRETRTMADMAVRNPLPCSKGTRRDAGMKQREQAQCQEPPWRS